MAYRNRQDRVDYAKRYYAENAEAVKKAVAPHRRRYIVRNRNIVRELKDGKPCTDCGSPYPFYVMQFDHVGTDKAFNVSSHVKKGTSVVTLMAEIAKCELVCANCHAIRTYKRLELQRSQ